VNRKALDQYAAFTDQRAELARRQEENGRGEAKIKQLIDTLDLRKDEAIERTFKVRAGHHSWHLVTPCFSDKLRAILLLRRLVFIAQHVSSFRMPWRVHNRHSTIFCLRNNAFLPHLII
jgi:hypothetical protein